MKCLPPTHKHITKGKTIANAGICWALVDTALKTPKYEYPFKKAHKEDIQQCGKENYINCINIFQQIIQCANNFFKHINDIESTSNLKKEDLKAEVGPSQNSDFVVMPAWACNVW